MGISEIIPDRFITSHHFSHLMARLLKAVCVIWVLSLISHPVWSAVITVNTDTSGSGCTIMDAIDSANADSALGGCLLTTTGIFGDDTIVLPADNNIQTLFSTNNTNPFGSNGLPIIRSKIIIEGNNGLVSRSSGAGTPSFRLFYVTTSGDLTLNNLRVMGGVADDGNNSVLSLGDQGPAIFNYGGTVTLSNCEITDNTAGNLQAGFAIHSISTGSYGARLTINNTAITSNTGQGVISKSQGSVTQDSALIIQDSVVSSSTGVGVAVVSGTAQISRSEVSDNGSGGVVTGNNVTLDIRDSTISGNRAAYGGGGLGIAIGYGSPVVSLINATISDNTAAEGGGILHSLGTLNLVNTVVSGNHTTSISGPGKEIRRDAGATGGTPVAGNQYNNLLGDSSITTAQALSGFTTTVSDITATSDGSKPTSLNMILRPLAKNGGPTKTHALVPGSPALNSAVTSYSTGGFFLGEGCAQTQIFPHFATVFRKDQRGIIRPQESKCDIGAFELEEESFFVIPLPSGKAVIFGL